MVGAQAASPHSPGSGGRTVGLPVGAGVVPGAGERQVLTLGHDPAILESFLRCAVRTKAITKCLWGVHDAFEQGV
jgi:hypothetical protein